MSDFQAGMIQVRHRFKVLAFFAMLLVVDWFLYFRHAGHFFQGDTIFHLNHRAITVSDYFKEFVQLNPSGWYRPLTSELFESILYPIAGLNPVPYRIPVYAVFFAITVAIYYLALTLTGRRLAAALAAFFFTIHTTNAYTTYDVSFMPELLYTFLYIVAVLAYLRYLGNDSRAAYWLSVGCFIGGLLSKEAAVTLPVTLFLTGVIFATRSGSLSERLARAVRSTAPHMLILAVYLGFVVGYLQVQGISVGKFLDGALIPNEIEYYVPAFNSGAGRNADLALTWAFNIPRGSWGDWHRLNPAMLGYLMFLRVLVLALMLAVAFGPQRRVVLFGAAWFWVTLLPALPLVNHFIPYYLFLSVIGLSLVVGVAFAWCYDLLQRFQPSLAAAVLLLVFGGLLYVSNRSIEGNIRNNSLLGGSSTLASNTLTDLKSFHPTLPSEATIYFADAKEPLAWHHDLGGLIKMAYRTDDLTVLYQSRDDLLSPGTPGALIFEVRNGRLVNLDVEHRFLDAGYFKLVDSDVKLHLSHSEVTAGRGSYTVTLNGLADVPVTIAYLLNDGPLETFTTGLDGRGQVTFDVALHTRKGVYTFFAFKAPNSADWVRAGATLTVY